MGLVLSYYYYTINQPYHRLLNMTLTLLNQLLISIQKWKLDVHHEARQSSQLFSPCCLHCFAAHQWVPLLMKPNNFPDSPHLATS